MPLRIDKPTTLYTIEEARKVVGVSQPTLWKAVKSGKLKAVKYAHYVFIAEDDLFRWRAECYRADMVRRRKTTNVKQKRPKRKSNAN